MIDNVYSVKKRKFEILGNVFLLSSADSCMCLNYCTAIHHLQYNRPQMEKKTRGEIPISRLLKFLLRSSLSVSVSLDKEGLHRRSVKVVRIFHSFRGARQIFSWNYSYLCRYCIAIINLGLGFQG